jgi:hypothetical protein
MNDYMLAYFMRNVLQCLFQLPTFHHNNRLSAPYTYYDRLPFKSTYLIDFTHYSGSKIFARQLFNNYFQSVCACTTFTDINCILLMLDGATVNECDEFCMCGIGICSVTN